MIKLFVKKILQRPHEIQSQNSFFDYSAAERKKIIKKASQEAVKEQRVLMKKFSILYYNN